MKIRRWGAPPIGFGLPEYELNKLATFNAEKSRGLLHDPQYEAYMAELQERFNAAQLADAEAKGYTVITVGGTTEHSQEGT